MHVGQTAGQAALWPGSVVRLAGRQPSSGVQAFARSFSELRPHPALSWPALGTASGVGRLKSLGTGAGSGRPGQALGLLPRRWLRWPRWVCLTGPEPAVAGHLNGGRLPA